MFELVDNIPQSAVIKVIGVGGGGGNAVNHMAVSNIEGVEFICANTDAQALKNVGARTVLQLGPGVLAIGGEFQAGACVSACVLLNTLTGYSWSHMFYSPHARATYHLLPSSSAGLEKVDLYGLALVGATITTTRVAGSGSGTDFEYVGSDVGPSVGVGVGGKYFFSDNLFFGAEGRLRYSAGEYTYTARAGNVSISDSQSTWSLSGFNVQLFAGLRL